MHEVVGAARKGAAIKTTNNTFSPRKQPKPLSGLDISVSRRKLGRRGVFSAGQNVNLKMKGRIAEEDQCHVEICEGED